MMIVIGKRWIDSHAGYAGMRGDRSSAACIFEMEMKDFEEMVCEFVVIFDRSQLDRAHTSTVLERTELAVYANVRSFGRGRCVIMILHIKPLSDFDFTSAIIDLVLQICMFFFV